MDIEQFMVAFRAKIKAEGNPFFVRHGTAIRTKDSELCPVEWLAGAKRRYTAGLSAEDLGLTASAFITIAYSADYYNAHPMYSQAVRDMLLEAIQ